MAGDPRAHAPAPPRPPRPLPTVDHSHLMYKRKRGTPGAADLLWQPQVTRHSSGRFARREQAVLVRLARTSLSEWPPSGQGDKRGAGGGRYGVRGALHAIKSRAGSRTPRSRPQIQLVPAQPRGQDHAPHLQDPRAPLPRGSPDGP